MFQRALSHLTENQYSWTVTGVAGFIGSHLLEHLLRLNQRVVGIDNFLTGHRRNLEEVQAHVGSENWSRFQFIEGDIRDFSQCQRVLKGSHFLLHQAALGSVPRSIEDPITTHEHNVNGFLNILAAAKEAKVRRVVYASSSSVYGDDPELPKKENRIGIPQSPYAVTKYVNEMYAKNFSTLYGTNTAGLRYFNVFGPRQDPNGPYAAVIPRWIKALCENQAVEIHGDGETSRDFCFVNNVVQANLLAALSENPASFNKVYNVAIGEKTTLNELYQWLRESLLPKYPHLRSSQPVYGNFRSGDIRHSLADISEAHKLLGYTPTHKIQDGLNESIHWYTENLLKF